MSNANAAVATTTTGTQGPVFSQCRFIQNGTKQQAPGSAVLVNSGAPAFINNVFTGNQAMAGGAVYVNDGSPRFVNCAFIGNLAPFEPGRGGAIYVRTSSAPLEITNCTFSGNRAGGTAGAIWDDSDADAVVLSNCILWANTHGAQSGFDTQIHARIPGHTVAAYSDIQGGYSGDGNIDSNPLFVGGPGGTWTSQPTYNASTRQMTLTNSTGSLIPGSLTGKFINPKTSQFLQSIIVSNTATTVTVWGDFSGQGITSGTPYQISDYHLQLFSPVIDSGNNGSILATGVTIDLDGNPRREDILAQTDCLQMPGSCGTAPIVDMGAYESRCDGADSDADGVPDLCDSCPDTPMNTPVSPHGCPLLVFDYDANGRVDQADVSQFRACASRASLPAAPGPDCDTDRLTASDTDRDGDVDLDDFGRLQRCYSGLIAYDPHCAD
jgi:hypothetical protein